MKNSRKILFSVFLMIVHVSVNGNDDLKQSTPTKNIVMLGSSTVWGSGLLDDSFVEPVDHFLKNSLSETIMPKRMSYKLNGKEVKPEIFKNKKLYKGEGYILNGEGASVEFDISGDELALCQVIRRTKNWGKISVYADGKLIDSFDNKNTTLGSAQMSFTADGKNKEFDLDRCFTYNHEITINGAPIKGQLHDKGAYMSKPPFTYYPEGTQYLVARQYSSTKPVKVIHTIIFNEAPPKDAKIVVNYNYGETIAHTKGTIGEGSDDQRIESPYGSGDVSHDPAHPTRLSTGLDFRLINRDAFWIHRFDSSAKRHIKLVIEGGVNPYFVINFATNRYHNLMNAGIGGWTAKKSLTDRYLRSYKNASQYYKPDVLFIALGGNDDWSEKDRLVSREIKNVSESQLKAMSSLELHSAKFVDEDNFTVVKNTGIIDTISSKSLRSKHLKGLSIKPGSFVRIGNYTGDNDSVAVRVVKSYDINSGELTWDKPLNTAEIICVDNLKDLVGAELAVREIKAYAKYMRQLVAKLKEVNPDMKIVLLNVYNTNFFTRQIWGYSELQKIIALENENVYTLNSAQTLQEFQKNSISGKKYTELKVDGSSEYTLPWKGHWQGYKVLVNGKDIYGKDCYILSGRIRALNNKKSGKDLEFSGNYTRGSYVTRAQKLVFNQNAPKSGTIRIERADYTWSGDYAHPNRYGKKVIGDDCVNIIKEIISRN